MKKYLSLYTIIHFIIDFACILFMTSLVSAASLAPGDFLMKAIIYNMLAFALPMIFGLVADILDKDEFTAAFGTFLVAVAYIAKSSSWPSVILLGVGNGLFHIGAGRKILMADQEHFAPSGIFISSGALGVFLGKSLSLDFSELIYILMIIIVILAIAASALLVVLRIRHHAGNESEGNIIKLIKKEKSSLSAGPLLICAAVLIFIVVIIRSYYGFLGNYSWKQGFAIGLIFTLCVVGGKCTGGIVADKIGLAAASVISLLGAGLLALLAPANAVIGCISIWLFNMTMPLTLKILSDILRFAPGFAFGTLMMALFIGTLPSMVFYRTDILATPVGMLILCLISLILLMAASLMVYGKKMCKVVKRGR